MDRHVKMGLSPVAMLGTGLVAEQCNRSKSRQVSNCWELGLLSPLSSCAQMAANSQLMVPDPKGIAFFDAGGHYIISVMHSAGPISAINSPVQGTEGKNKATPQGTITYSGTYLVNKGDRTIAIHIDGSSFPNWDGADQKRIFAITGDQLKLTAPLGPTVGTTQVAWKRAQ